MRYTYFLIHYKTHSMKTFESNSKNTYWKVFVNFELSKNTQMGTFINNDILNIRILISIFIQLVAKYYQTNNLIAQDLWVHL